MVKIIKNSAWDIIYDRRENKTYSESLKKYLNCLDPLFEKAKAMEEFDFICTLLRVRSLQDAGWDPWENTLSAGKKLYNLQKRIKDFETVRHLFLWLYGHIVEASEPYETIANMLNIVDGRTFITSNFSDKKRGRYFVPQSPSEKIDTLGDMAKKVNMPDVVVPFQDVFDRELRNAIFHSDYVLYDGKVRLLRGFSKEYSHNEVQAILNKALAYINTFETLISYHVSSYKTPKLVRMYPKHTQVADEEAITILRKGHGVIGLQSNWSVEEVRQGQILARIGRFTRRESKMLENNPENVMMPPDYRKKINMILPFLPGFIRKWIVAIINKYEWI